MDAGEDFFGRHAGVLGRYTDGMLSPPLQMLPVMVAGWVNRRQLAVIDYGYRRITAMLRQDGWPVNHKRVERIWHQEGLKVPRRQPGRADCG